MDKLELNIDEQNQLSFDVEIQGTDSRDVAVKFVVEGENGLQFAFPGKVESGTVSIDVPVMSRHIAPDTYQCKLEFIVEGEKYFTPMQDSVTFVQPVKVSATLKKNKAKAAKPAPAKKKPIKEEKTQPTIKVGAKVETLNDRIADTLQDLAKAGSLTEMAELYATKCMMKEGQEVDIREVMPLIDIVAKNRHGVSFVDFAAKVK